MANYKESEETGTIKKWQRARQVIIDNPYNEVPSSQFYETEISVFPDNSTQEKSVGSLGFTLSDPTLEIPVINPVTFEQTATTFPVGQLQLLLASVYIYLAKQRDGINPGV